jgi:hypothetical protein
MIHKILDLCLNILSICFLILLGSFLQLNKLEQLKKVIIKMVKLIMQNLFKISVMIFQKRE